MVNKLANESSLYLLQYANDPVNWYPWCSEAITNAIKENKPILLSIGYFSCHWCHVMAREVFKDKETADLMNKLFVNIKIDAEERPDIDKTYQMTHKIITAQTGGWPLTTFISPMDLVPFYSGTYYPLNKQQNLPSFKEVLITIDDYYHNHYEEIEEQNMKILNYLLSSQQLIKHIDKLNIEPIFRAIEYIDEQYDVINGGFRVKPKFPQLAKLLFLIPYRPEIVANTLSHMALGGIYDHLEGGFFRYTVDTGWKIPNFEKMLYDNGQFIYLYTLALLKLPTCQYTNVIHDTASWIIENMQSPTGGYYSSIDTDLDGKEGAFYLWSKSELQNSLSEDEFKFIQEYFSLTRANNFDEKWYLSASIDLSRLSEKLYLTQTQLLEMLKSIQQKLRDVRNLHGYPMKDNKILTSWNALAIKGMAKAGEVLGEPRYYHSAIAAFKYIKDHLWRDGKLFSAERMGNENIQGFLDDYAFLLDAVLTLLKISWDSEYLQFAIELAEDILYYFYDVESGGFYYTSMCQKKIIYRQKILNDGAIPSGNAIALQALLSFGYLIGETKYIQVVEKSLKYAWPSMMMHPAEHCGLLICLKQFIEPDNYIIIYGKSKEIELWKRKCKEINPSIDIYAIPVTCGDLPRNLNQRKSSGSTIANMCYGIKCERRFSNLNELVGYLTADAC